MLPLWARTKVDIISGWKSLGPWASSPGRSQYGGSRLSVYSLGAQLAIGCPLDICQTQFEREGLAFSLEKATTHFSHFRNDT